MKKILRDIVISNPYVHAKFKTATGWHEFVFEREYRNRVRTFGIAAIKLIYALGALLAPVALAQPPMMINYQGRLLSGTNLYNGPANLTFRLFNVPTGGSALFVSTNFATVVDGLYATAIGQFVTLGSLDDALTNAQMWLEVEVNGTTLTPREQVLAVPYARAVHGLRVTSGHGIILNPAAGTNVIGATAFHAMICGGSKNSIQPYADYATIGGGYFNRIQTSAVSATIGGGHRNAIHSGASIATIGGGYENTIQHNGHYATIPGGQLNSATNYAFAAGRQAKANHTGSFVWGDSTGFDVASSAPNQVTFRASGGFRIFSNPGLTLGVQLAAGGSSWSSISDRNAKENIEPIDTSAILERVAELPLSAWTYKDDPTQRRYIGPMAQDFHAAFGLGDERTINTLDADGVALAAIQALAQRSEALAQQNEALARENAELRAELERQREEFNKRLQALETR
jgi:hypothetical protein